MTIAIPSIWLFFCVSLAVILFTTLVMNIQEKYFFTKDVVLRKFSIKDLEFASTSTEVANIIQGMYLLPTERSTKAIKAFRLHMMVDFMFMIAVYMGIFLLCMKAADKMTSLLGEYFFSLLAWGQLVAWICDLFENRYLLNQLSADAKPATEEGHIFFQRVVAVKWILTLLGSVCALAAFFYFWVTGLYSVESLTYLLVIFIEIIIFVMAGKMISRKLGKSING